MATASFCSGCGAPRAVGAAFCSSCGRPFEATAAQLPLPVARADPVGAADVLQILTWIVAIPSIAGIIWLWANTGPEISGARIVVVGIFGLLWVGVLILVGRILVGIGALVWIMFRRPGRCGRIGR